ncbi:protein DDI1-like [Pontoporia blainvillei]|uniref:Protein DDI1-like n=1 Tax=Pontoporia blainvillei TaxID=48723 RepID=A0ABX0SB20_PONBL|nr:protein DDI1-like [Pontoporia blainvillei]
MQGTRVRAPVREDPTCRGAAAPVSPDFELHSFRVLCELESGIPAEEIQIVYMERLLADGHCSLGSYGLKDGDMVVLLQKENVRPRPLGQTSSLPQSDFTATAVPATSSSRQHHQHQRAQSAQQSRGLDSGKKMTSAQGLDSPALIRSMLLSNPHDLSLLEECNPALAKALLSRNLETFSQVLMKQQRERSLREQERLSFYSAGPFDLEAQAKIEEEIQQQNIEENMNIAMEEVPESFG